jgi:hypothetical protein
MKYLTFALIALTLTGCGVNPKLDRIATCTALSVASLGLVAPICIKSIQDANKAEEKAAAK